METLVRGRRIDLPECAALRQEDTQDHRAAGAAVRVVDAEPAGKLEGTDLAVVRRECPFARDGDPPRTVGHEDPAEQGAGIQRLRDPAFGQGGVEQPPLRVPEPQRVDIHKGKGRGFPFVEGRLAVEAGIEEAAHGLEALVRFLDAVAHVGRGFPEPALDVPVHHIGDELRGGMTATRTKASTSLATSDIFNPRKYFITRPEQRILLRITGGRRLPHVVWPSIAQPLGGV